MLFVFEGGFLGGQGADGANGCFQAVSCSSPRVGRCHSGGPSISKPNFEIEGCGLRAADSPFGPKTARLKVPLLSRSRSHFADRSGCRWRKHVYSTRLSHILNHNFPGNILWKTGRQTVERWLPSSIPGAFTSGLGCSCMPVPSARICIVWHALCLCPSCRHRQRTDKQLSKVPQLFILRCRIPICLSCAAAFPSIYLALPHAEAILLS